MSPPPWVTHPQPAPAPPDPGSEDGRRGPSPAVAVGVVVGAVVLLAVGAVLVFLLRDAGGASTEPALEILPEVVPSAPDPEPDPEPEPDPTPVADADLEIILNWSSHADLDLTVTAPQDDEESPGSLPTAGTGTRDTTANDGCARTRAPAQERVRWEHGEARPGSYEVQVQYVAECDEGTGPQDFEVRVVVPGVGVATFADTIAPGDQLVLIDVRFPSGEVFDLRTADPVGPPDDPSPAPPPTPAPPPDPQPIPRGNVNALPSGLFCRDLRGAGYPYWDAVRYWEREGRPARMDATGDGIPCTTVYPWNDVRDYWGQLVDPNFQEGGDVP